MRLIDTDAFIAETRELYKQAGWGFRDVHYSQSDVEFNISMMPTVATTKHGKFIEKLDPNGDSIYECSECGQEWVLIEGDPEDNLYNYCPYCGTRMHGIIRAKMDGGEE